MGDCVTILSHTFWGILRGKKSRTHLAWNQQVPNSLAHAYKVAPASTLTSPKEPSKQAPRELSTGRLVRKVESVYRLKPPVQCLHLIL